MRKKNTDHRYASRSDGKRGHAAKTATLARKRARSAKLQLRESR